MATYKRGSGNYKSSFLNIITKKTSVTTTSDDSVNDDTELFLVLKPNKHYCGQVMLQFNSHADADIKFTFKAISGTSYARYATGAPAAPLGDVPFGTENTENTLATNQNIVIFFWVLTGSAGGTLMFQWAQATSDVNDTIVQEGSTLVVYEA